MPLLMLCYPIHPHWIVIPSAFFCSSLMGKHWNWSRRNSHQRSVYSVFNDVTLFVISKLFIHNCNRPSAWLELLMLLAQSLKLLSLSDNLQHGLEHCWLRSCQFATLFFVRGNTTQDIWEFEEYHFKQSEYFVIFPWMFSVMVTTTPDLCAPIGSVRSPTT